jgi:hypothetical protein
MKGMPQGDDLGQHRGDASAKIRAIYHVVIVSDNTRMVTAAREPRKGVGPGAGGRPERREKDMEVGYIFAGGNFAGSITYQTFPTS